MNRGGSVLFLEVAFIAANGFASAHLGTCEQNSGVFPNQLQAVAVTGCNKAIMTLLLTFCRKGAKNIVCFISFHCDDSVTHILQQFLDNRQLMGKLFGHSLALRLISIIHLVTEGRRLQVKGTGNRIRVYIV